MLYALIKKTKKRKNVRSSLWRGFIVKQCVDVYDARPDLKNRIRSVTYLIRGAAFRPRGIGKSSLEICPLNELLDMYYTHEASLRSDKVYALIGLSSDGFSTSSLLPNYNIA